MAKYKTWSSDLWQITAWENVSSFFMELTSHIESNQFNDCCWLTITSYLMFTWLYFQQSAAMPGLTEQAFFQQAPWGPASQQIRQHVKNSKTVRNHYQFQATVFKFILKLIKKHWFLTLTSSKTSLSIFKKVLQSEKSQDICTLLVFSATFYFYTTTF